MIIKKIDNWIFKFKPGTKFIFKNTYFTVQFPPKLRKGFKNSVISVSINPCDPVTGRYDLFIEKSMLIRKIVIIL